MFSFKKFWHYSWGIVIRPTPTLKRLAAEPSLAYGFAAYFLFGLLYGLFSLVVYFSGHLPRGILVNFIPARTYYLWEAGFMIPVTMQIYILFAALAHLLSRLQRGQGSFEGTLSVLGFTYSIPLIILFWLPGSTELCAFLWNSGRAMDLYYLSNGNQISPAAEEITGHGYETISVWRVSGGSSCRSANAGVGK